MSARPVHFDLTAEDPERLVTFYNKTFGWTYTKWDGPGDAWTFSTGSEGPGIDGGIWPRQPGEGPGTVNTISVASIDETLASIKAAGGTIVVDTFEIPGTGLWAMATDT